MRASMMVVAVLAVGVAVVLFAMHSMNNCLEEADAMCVEDQLSNLDCEQLKWIKCRSALHE